MIMNIVNIADIWLRFWYSLVAYGRNEVIWEPVGGWCGQIHEPSGVKVEDHSGTSISQTPLRLS